MAARQFLEGGNWAGYVIHQAADFLEGTPKAWQGEEAGEGSFPDILGIKCLLFSGYAPFTSAFSGINDHS